MQALQVFLSRGIASKGWGETMERLDLDITERTTLAGLLETVDLPSYVSPASLRRLRLNHEQAYILGTAAVAYGTFLLRGGGRGAYDGSDDRVPAIGASIPVIGQYLGLSAEPSPKRLIGRMEFFVKIARGEASLPPLDLPDDSAYLEEAEAPTADGSPSAASVTVTKPRPPGRVEHADATARPRVADRDLPKIAVVVQIEDLQTCILALRSWAREEGMDGPQLTAAIRTVGAGPLDMEIFKLGFSELFGMLGALTPTHVVDAELKQPGLRALALGVVVYGRLTLARFERNRSAAALATLQERDGRLQESLEEDQKTLNEMERFASLLLMRVTPSTSPDERIYPSLFALQREIAAALKPWAIEEIAKATLSGRLPAVTDADLANAEDAPTAAEIISTIHKPVVLRPTIGIALHGLVIWSRGGSFLPAVDKAIHQADLAPGLQSWFERGARILSVLPPEFDPADLAEAEVDEAGMVAAAMGTLVYARLVREADGEEILDLEARAAEVSEFATYIAMCLEPDTSPLHPGVLADLEAIRARGPRRRGDAPATEAAKRPTKTRWKMPAISFPKIGNSRPLWRAFGGLIVLSLALTTGLRFWTTQGPPPLTSYVDIVEVVALVRTPGEVTARIQEFQLGESKDQRAQNATALWLRLSNEYGDPALRLVLQDHVGEPIASVQAGRVKWVR